VFALRGGSWNNDAGNCRSANRNNNAPTNRNNNIGFRLVLPAVHTGKWILPHLTRMKFCSRTAAQGCLGRIEKEASGLVGQMDVCLEGSDGFT